MATETTVEVVDTEPENDSANTSEIISAVDAHVAAGDAEDAQDAAESAAEDSADYAEDSATAALIATESAIVATESAAVVSAEVAEMRAIAADQAETSRNLLKIFEGMQGQRIEELPEPMMDDTGEEEPASGSWYSKKWW